MQRAQLVMRGNTEPLREEPPPCPAWTSKTQYILAQLGLFVGLSTICCFPYLCYQNGGGAFILLYLLFLFLLGIPLLFLELAARQCLHQGSINIWRSISPRLAGSGVASCLVCMLVALYYNGIIAWSLLYLARSFQHPLPWESCPSTGPNHTDPQCALSSPTTYFWYRQTLDVTPEMGVSGGLQPALVGVLLGTWVLVGASLRKGIKPSGKALYISTLFPYFILFCLLIRGLLLEGDPKGIRTMFTPKVSAWGTGQAWRQAATQVFLTLGLDFGSVITYTGYGKRRSNSHRDSMLVAGLSTLTSLLATLVVFTVLGAHATRHMRHCLHRNVELVSQALAVGWLPETAWPPGNLTALLAPQNRTCLQGLPPALRDTLGLTDCSPDKEMNKGLEGLGLAFIVFTETVTLLLVAPLWSSLFFLMLVGLGLGTMLGNAEAIFMPLCGIIPVLCHHHVLLTVLCCARGFALGLPFVQCSGSYLVAVFDDYVATLPLAMGWVYGTERFMADAEKETGHWLWWLYGPLRRFASPEAMVTVLVTSLGQLALHPPTYQAWNHATAALWWRPYPPWALALTLVLMTVAVLHEQEGAPLEDGEELCLPIGQAT